MWSFLSLSLSFSVNSSVAAVEFKSFIDPFSRLFPLFLFFSIWFSRSWHILPLIFRLLSRLCWSLLSFTCLCRDSAWFGCNLATLYLGFYSTLLHLPICYRFALVHLLFSLSHLVCRKTSFFSIDATYFDDRIPFLISLPLSLPWLVFTLFATWYCGDLTFCKFSKDLSLSPSRESRFFFSDRP